MKGEGPLSLALRVCSVIVQRLLMSWRWGYYNVRAFVWYRPAPLSTRFYGKVSFSHVPVRVRIGQGVTIGEDILLAPGRNGLIELGDGVSLNRNCVMVAVERITLGRNVAVADNVAFRDQEHRFQPGKGIAGTGYDVGAIEIGDNCWIGRGAFIGPGTRIGRNCIVGANSLVHGEFPDNVLIAGTPAVIKKHFAPPDACEDERPSP